MPRNLDLDERLKLAASFVRPDAVFADVGCDHGRLSVYLIQQCAAKCGFACDIRPQPLEKARQLIIRKNLQDKITPVLTDGLQDMQDKNISDVIIAGIGGEVLSHIVQDADFLKYPSIRIILQPQSKEHLLRKTLYNLGFKIEHEECVRSGRFIYTVMVASFCGDCVEIDDFFAYTGLLPLDKTPINLQKLSSVSDTLREIALSLKNSPAKQEEYLKTLALADEISSII